MTILDKIIAYKKDEVEALKAIFWTSQQDRSIYILQIQKSETSFYNALKNKKRKWPKLIAEVKKGSPSQGLIRADFDVAEIVKLYDQYATSMSILTDEKFFLGSLENLKIARKNTNKPLLRKDFIIDEFQIYEARLAGANAVLLLASVLDLTQIQEFLNIVHSLGMDALVEVHDQEELAKVLKTDARIIGINNRNLKDFSIDLENSNRLAQLIPEDKIIVSESGINSKADIRKVRKNADAILVGTAITKSTNMDKKIRDIVGIPEVKICGITNIEDAEAAIECGANYLGFIFYEKSPRNITPEKCAEIIKKTKGINSNFKAVGVFVNKKFEQVLKIVQDCNLDIVQLHGEERFEYVENLVNTLSSYLDKGENSYIEVWKALRIKDKKDLEQVKEFPNVEGILLDTFNKDAYGGTGKTFDWEILKDFYPEQKIVLAGGLSAENVQLAIESFYPDVLDISSKIELKPGKKDLVKLKKLFKSL